MNEDKASPDLRYLIRAVRAGFGLSNSLANVNTSELPNGATCYVIEDAALWVLDKDSTQAGITGYVVTPINGVGRWFRQQTSETKAPPAQMVGAGSNSFAVDGNWGISSSSNFSLLSLNEPALWSITALGGILTYNGEPKTMLAQAVVVAQVGNAGSPREVFLVISHNNDFTGAASLSSVSTSNVLSTASQNTQISASRVVQLNTGDTLRLKMAAAAGASSLTATQVSLAVAA